MKLEIAHAFGSRFTPIAKALQLQLVTDYDSSSPQTGRGAFGDSFVGNWCLVAPPPAPTLDPTGKVTAACEVAGIQLGDQIIALGQRDVRWSKFAQDAKPGEVALFSSFGARLFLGQTATALTSVGGAFLNFDSNAKTVGIAGFPAKPGAGAPYLSIGTDSIGLVSATGAASVAVKGDQVTVSGAGASLDVGSLSLGKGASDPVVTVSLLQAVLSTIVAWMATHVHAGVTTGIGVSGISAAVPLTATGSTRVKAAI